MIVEISAADEIEKITRLINDAFSTVALEFGFTRESVPTFPAFIAPSMISERMTNGLHLFAYSTFDRYIGTVSYKKTDTDRVFLVERLAVDPAFRHKRVGTELMAFITEKIREEEGRIVEVRIVDENALLKNWYSSLGFVETRIDRYNHLPFSVGVLRRTIA
jgi:GNAT superfamily N-acetyltransferase